MRDRTETIVTNDETGGQKGAKLARFALVPQLPLWLVAEHFGRGAAKYDDHNWRRGYKWSLSMDALSRHLSLFWDGEDVDEETGSLHVVAATWHGMVLTEFASHPRYKEFDDRFMV